MPAANTATQRRQRSLSGRGAMALVVLIGILIPALLVSGAGWLDAEFALVTQIALSALLIAVLIRLLPSAEEISLQQRAEAARDLSEAKFLGAFECNPDSVSIARLEDGLLSDVNHVFETLTGYNRAEAVGKTTIEIGMWEDPGQRDVLLGLLAKNDAVREFCWNVRHRDGSVRTCLLNATLFTVGMDTYMMAVMRDITEQRRMEAQKEEVDRALLRLAQGTQGFSGAAFLELLVADLATALHADHAFIALRMPDDADGIRTLTNLKHGLAIPDCVFRISGSPCELVLRGELTYFATGLQIRFPTDTLLEELGYDSYAGAPIRDAGGSVIGVLAVAHSQPLDNPELVRSLLQVFSERASAELERKQAELALRNSEQRFAAIFHASPVAMALSRFGGDFALLDVNRAFEQLHRRSRRMVLGQNAAILDAYVDFSDRDRIVDSLEHSGRVERQQAWMKLGDGNRALVQTSANVFELAGERLLILTGEDVSDVHEIKNRILDLNSTLEQRVTERTEALHRANQELAAALDSLHVTQDELVRREKLAALGSLVAGIAHELNTPIGNSLMAASTLADRTREFASAIDAGLKRSTLDSFVQDAGKAGDILVRNLMRAAGLVNSFKQVAMDQTSSQRRRFSLAEVTAEIMLTLSPTLRKSGNRVTQHISDQLQMHSYPGPLGQVLTNLVNNALLHGLAGNPDGMITISAASNAAGWITLSVHDDGAGIAEADLGRIFDPFFTTRLGDGGSGLGLHIAHNIVTGVLGGRIRVDSEVGNGATFTLDLPVTAPQIQPT